MSEAKIFLLGDSGENVSKMVEMPYEAEEVLQRLLVIEPDLLPGDQINPENPRAWLLVKQEMGVPGAALLHEDLSKQVVSEAHSFYTVRR